MLHSLTALVYLRSARGLWHAVSSHEEGVVPPEVSELQSMVHARPAKPRPAGVLLAGGVSEGRQSIAAKAVAGEARESKLLAR